MNTEHLIATAKALVADHKGLLAMDAATEWQKYPNDLAGFQSAFVDAWWNLTLAEGFKFTEGEEGDGVFFDTW